MKQNLLMYSMNKIFNLKGIRVIIYATLKINPFIIYIYIYIDVYRYQKHSI